MNNKTTTARNIPHKQSARIKEFKGDINFISRLREMGFGEGSIVTKFSQDAYYCIILNMEGRKIYLSEAAAECMIVELI
jgi:Fe2+ transport system protein FeoA